MKTTTLELKSGNFDTEQQVVDAITRELSAYHGPIGTLDEEVMKRYPNGVCHNVLRITITVEEVARVM
jgi:hypothetical protein